MLAAGRLAPVAVALGLTLAAALLLTAQVDGIGSGFWIDEAIAVGIASHELAEIPGALRLDGSPPLYYLLLHGWMLVAGTEEAATRGLSLAFAVLAVPVAAWAGAAVGGVRAGALAALGAVGSPFVVQYAQETRMYSLVVVLSLLAAGGFVLAFVHGRRGHLVTVAVAMTALLYTHGWGVFLAGGLAVAWLWLWRRGRVDGRDGLLVGAVVAVAFLPWLPTLVHQALHTGAPWSETPPLFFLLDVPGRLFGYLSAPLLGYALVRCWRRGLGEREETAAVLALIGIAAAGLAWGASQFAPAWAGRYYAVLLGPLLLAAATVLARGGGRPAALALVAAGAIWVVTDPPTVKSNARTVATGAAAGLRPGDLVVSTQPEQVPVLHRYLPAGLNYVTLTGFVPDPRVTDWRDGVARMRAASVERDLEPWLAGAPRGRRILLVTQVPPRVKGSAPWDRGLRFRGRRWARAVRADPRLRRVQRLPRSTFPRRSNAIRAELFVRR